MNIKDELIKYSELRKHKEELETELKSVNERIDIIVKATSSAMLDDGITSMKLDGVGSFSLAEELYPSVKNQADLYTYLRENGQADIIKETVHFMSLKAINNLHNEQSGCDLPGVESFRKLQIRMRKA